MVGNVNNKSPLDALSNLMNTAFGEVGRAAGELKQDNVDDINSISTAIETGGFLGGALQFLDVASPGNAVANLADAATGPGKLDPKMKEGISAFTNFFSGTPFALITTIKDLVDMSSAPSTPGVRPSAPNTVPPPNVGQLTGGQGARAPSGGSGFETEGPGRSRPREQVAVEMEGARQSFDGYFQHIDTLRNSPEVKAEMPLLYEALNDPNTTLGDANALIVGYAFEKNPDLVMDVLSKARDGGIPGYTYEPPTRHLDADFRAYDPRQRDESFPRLTTTIDETAPASSTAPTNGVAPAAPTDAAAPTAPPPGTGGGDMSNFMQQAMGMFQQIAGPLGMGLQVVGSIISNPIVANFLAPLLVQGLNAIAPGLGVALAPILPVALPMIGQLMQGAGGMLASQAGGGAGQPGAAPAGLPLGDIGNLVGSLAGAFGGAGGAPALAI